MVNEISGNMPPGNLAGLKRALRQDQQAKDLIQEAQKNLKEFNEQAGLQAPSETDGPVRRGQVIDIIA